MAALYARWGIKGSRSIFFFKTVFPNQKYFAEDSTQKINLYKTLGLSSSASHNEIKKAYDDLSFKYHPDRNVNGELATHKLREVTEAYEILGSYVLRKNYDKGVPLPIMKEAVKKDSIDHKLKYQEFFNSRTAQSTFNNPLGEEIQKLSAPKQTKKVDDNVESSINAVQTIIVLFLGCVIFFSRR